MVNETTIGVSNHCKSLLDKRKVHERETYNSVIERLITVEKQTEKKK